MIVVVLIGRRVVFFGASPPKLDFNMPNKNGVELARELRRMRPTMPIAIITANLQNDVIEATKAVPATFVAKPITEAGLKKFLAEAGEALSNEQT
jgi:DNA-binding LytR/AlgR family response regulator